MEESVSNFSKKYASSKKFVRKSNPRFEERKEEEDDEWLKIIIFYKRNILSEVSIKSLQVLISLLFLY